MNQQQRTTTVERTAANAFYWYQIFALDSDNVEAQKMLSWHGGFLTIANYHHIL